MKVITKIGRGTAIHAAQYEPTSGKIDLYCDSLKYPNYFAEIRDPAEPTSDNITCKKCLKIMDEKGDWTK